MSRGRPNSPFWSPEKIKRLVDLWMDDRLSAVEIAIELGTSKNAVVGKAHRAIGPRKMSPLYGAYKEKYIDKMKRAWEKRTPWQGERAALLRRCHAAGFTLKQTAAAFGRDEPFIQRGRMKLGLPPFKRPPKKHPPRKLKTEKSAKPVAVYVRPEHPSTLEISDRDARCFALGCQHFSLPGYSFCYGCMDLSPTVSHPHADVAREVFA